MRRLKCDLLFWLFIAPSREYLDAVLGPLFRVFEHLRLIPLLS